MRVFWPRPKVAFAALVLATMGACGGADDEQTTVTQSEPASINEPDEQATAPDEMDQSSQSVEQDADAELEPSEDQNAAPDAPATAVETATGTSDPESAQPDAAADAAPTEASEPVEREPGADGLTFSLENVERLARDLAEAPFSAGRALPEAAGQLNYDQYRRIQNTKDSALWNEAPQGIRVEPDPRGYLFTHEVKLNVVDEAGVQPRPYSTQAFDFLDLPLSEEIRESLGFSGFRALTPLNQAGKFDELISFRGASFFRALGAGTVYGASGRGLSVGTAASEGEEFPHFREFWIVKPEPGRDSLRVYALLDGKSVTGAFQFDVEPGPNSKVDVTATIYPRRKISNLGIAPLTSMYQFSPHDALKEQNDYRPAVHDSEGLAFRQRNGEWAWRPLTNPAELQVSVLAEDVPFGFGLMQRKRAFDDFSDIEAGYHLRPSVWIEPRAGWGKGKLTLVEIPTVNEYNDNIVLFWQPAAAWEAGSVHRISYSMFWGLRPPAVPDVVAVAETRVGRVPGDSNRVMFVIDFALADDALMEELEPSVSSSAGKILNPVIKRNPEAGLTRLSFELDPENTQLSELRAVLLRGGKPVTETWLYRWRRR